MDDKNIDNKILTTKEKINKIDNKLDIEKKRIKKLDNMQENVNSINKNINHCIYLLSKSVKGTNANHIFNDMYDTNNDVTKKMNKSIDEELALSKKGVNKLYEEKEKYIKEKQKEKKSN